jgi:hypothetical protein
MQQNQNVMIANKSLKNVESDRKKLFLVGNYE